MCYNLSMKTNNQKYMVDKKKFLRESDHLTRPPRMNRNKNSVRKAKKSK
jgi:hypothetical protein